MFLCGHGEVFQEQSQKLLEPSISNPIVKLTNCPVTFLELQLVFEFHTFYFVLSQDSALVKLHLTDVVYFNRLVASVLVQKGKLLRGNSVVAGNAFAKVL